MDDNFSCHSQRLTLKSLNKKITPDNRLRHHRIRFNFICEAVIFNWLREESTSPAVFVGCEEEDVMEASTTAIITSDRPAPDIRAALENVLVGPVWPMSDRLRLWLFEFSLKEACKALSTYIDGTNRSYVSVNLELRLFLAHNHIYTNIDIDRDMDRDSGGIRMIPALDSSIQLLRKYELGTGSGVVETCSICLEDFSGRKEDSSGREVLLCMPCDHVFHEKCIKKWLKMSHYCPLCRYKMPIN